MNSGFDSKKEIRYLLQKKSNSFCADCFDSCALYVDITIGVFLCLKCSEIHKKFGFLVKNTATDDFSIQEIETLKQSGNQNINKKLMSLYQSGSTKIPFGASFVDRESFLTEKYIAKKWYSQCPNSSFLDYNPHHFSVQEEYSEEEDQPTPYASSTEPSDFSEISSPKETYISNFYQNPNEIINYNISPEPITNIQFALYRSSENKSKKSRNHRSSNSSTFKKYKAQDPISHRANMAAPNIHAVTMDQKADEEQLVVYGSSLGKTKRNGAKILPSIDNSLNSYSNSTNYSNSNPFDAASSNSLMNSVPNPFDATSGNVYNNMNLNQNCESKSKKKTNARKK